MLIQSRAVWKNVAGKMVVPLDVRPCYKSLPQIALLVKRHDPRHQDPGRATIRDDQRLARIAQTDMLHARPSRKCQGRPIQHTHGEPCNSYGRMRGQRIQPVPHGSQIRLIQVTDVLPARPTYEVVVHSPGKAWEKQERDEGGQ